MYLNCTGIAEIRVRVLFTLEYFGPFSIASTSGIIHLDITSCTVKRMMQNNTNKIKETIRSRKKLKHDQ